MLLRNTVRLSFSPAENEERTKDCADRLKVKHGNQNIVPVKLDLSSLKSVHECAEKIRSAYKNIDVLINNAGVMVPPYTITEDGFELQIRHQSSGTFCVHRTSFAEPDGDTEFQVVTLSSTAHLRGKINFNDLKSEKRYIANLAYAQSKLANLLFAYELQRRLDKANARTISVAAHPELVANRIASSRSFQNLGASTICNVRTNLQSRRACRCSTNAVERDRQTCCRRRILWTRWFRWLERKRNAC